MKKNPSLLEKWAPLLGAIVEDERPKGFESVEEIAKTFKLSNGQAAAKLRDLLAAKKITRLKGRNENGRVVWFYGIKPIR